MLEPLRAARIAVEPAGVVERLEAYALAPGAAFGIVDANGRSPTDR